MARSTHLSQTAITALGSGGTLTLTLTDLHADIAHYFAAVEFYQDADGLTVSDPTSGTVAFTVKTVVLPGSFQAFTSNTVDMSTDGVVQVDWAAPSQQLQAVITTAAGDSVAYARLTCKGMEN